MRPEEKGTVYAVFAEAIEVRGRMPSDFPAAGLYHCSSGPCGDVARRLPHFVDGPAFVLDASAAAADRTPRADRKVGAAMPIRRLFTGVFIVGAALLSQATCALPIVHESTETFYSSGGTLVEGCRGPGCPAASFTIGDVSGTPLWRIEEQTPYQLVGESLYSLRFRYRVFVLDPDLPLFGFSIANNGFAAELYNQMNPNWTNQHDEAQWIWSSAFGNPILPGTPALDRSFVAATAPLARIGVGFGPVEFLLRIDDEFVVRSSPDWRASVPVESPATIALVWVGLLAIGAALGAGSRAQGSPNRRRLLSDPPTRFIDEGQRQ